MPKVTKKAGKKTNDESKGRVKLSELPQGERDTLVHGLIDELYGGKLDAEEKSKRRQRLRTIDKGWLETYATFIERRGYNKPKEKPAKATKTTKKAAAKSTAAKTAVTDATTTPAPDTTPAA